MRSVLNEDQFTPFGLWIRQYLRPSGDGLSVTNLDYVIEDYKNKKIMLLEEKQNNGNIHRAQFLTFEVVDYALSQRALRSNYEYWGFYVLRFKNGATMPGPGMMLNGCEITVEQLTDHLNFRVKHCEPVKFKWSQFKIGGKS